MTIEEKMDHFRSLSLESASSKSLNLSVVTSSPWTMT